MKANNTKISGFNLSGSTASGYAGIRLYYSNGCTIENNKLSNNACGIYLWFANKNNILRNTATGNGDYGGILLQSSTYNNVSGNNVFSNKRGVFFGTSSDNTLSSNTVKSSTGDWGLFVCGRSPRSLIYNNYFYETNMSIRQTLSGAPDTLNIANTSGTNIVGGKYLGGNYWARPDGKGFSQTAVDMNGDGFADSPYVNATRGPYTDKLPLVIPKSSPTPILPVAKFSSNVTSGTTPLTVLFNSSTSTNANNISWNFGDGTPTQAGTKVTHKFTNTGTSAKIFTVTLTATNANGTNNTTGKITVNPVAAPVKPPAAAFTVSPASGGTTATNFTFTDNSTNSPTRWSWNFGDGQSGTGKVVTHKYAAAKTYTVKLTAGNAAGNSTTNKSVVVGNSSVKTTASLAVPPESGGTTAANNTTDGTGKNATQSNVIGAAPKAPVAAFTYTPTTVKKGTTVKFTDTSKNTAKKWNWTFSDNGATATTKTVSHMFKKAGTFKVSLKVSNDAGYNTVTKSITVK